MLKEGVCAFTTHIGPGAEERSSVFDCVSRFGYVFGTVVYHDAA